MRWIVLAVWLLWHGAILAAETVYYPRPESTLDRRSDYAIKLLELALKKSGADYRLRPTALTMPQSRALLEVDNGSRFVTITWAMTSRLRERQALPVRIPIDKGLLGWRLALVKRDRADLFKDVRSVRALGAFTAGMGHDWPDVQVFRANELAVTGVQYYELLFRMLANGRFDYFPRSVTEVWDELDSHRAQDLVVARHILLHYPAPQYYFVSKDNGKLAAAVHRGLERTIADGSFERLFQRYHGKHLKRVDFAHRRILELDNPDLPPETPLARNELWLRLP